MGVGPAYAIPMALKKCGLTVKDIDVFEVNEAFASQASWCVE
jgi:acetyl-CoA acetyltransferase